jgi:uncharacterized protein with von Willebrand factor type A (vWA) domain
VIAGFARCLRAAGLAVPTGSVLAFTEALGRVGIDRRERVYWAGRATLLCRPEELPTYDRVFDAYWLDSGSFLLAAAPSATPLTLALDEEDDEEPAVDEPEVEEPAGDLLSVRYSALEVLRDRDFGGLSPEEWAEAQRLLTALRVTAETKPSRRRRPARRARHGHPDLRATVRRALPTGGVPMHRAWAVRVGRPRRMVLLLDVSGSMEPYARALLRFAHAAVSARRVGSVEAFALGTRLTRLTRQLRRQDPEAALAEAAAEVVDWSGGTRLGLGLQEFNDRFGVRGMARGAVVVIGSDGWDRGDPEMLAGEMGRLSRVAHRVVWVNPLKASPGYAPLARGMAAALPFVDEFVEGHSLASLDRLAAVIGGVPA